MKTIVCALLLLCCAAYGQSLTNATIMSNSKTGVFQLQGKIGNQFVPWLLVVTYNENWKQVGYEPGQTHIISDYKPMFRKTELGQWEIIFVKP